MTTQCVTSLIDRLNLQHLLESLDEPEHFRSQPPLPPLGPLYEGRSYAFERLFDAVWLEPHRLNKLLAAERSLVM
eukprot:gene50519-61804_t